MRAMVQRRYGSAGVLSLEDVATPSIDDKGVLVRIHTASVNALDWHTMRGQPYFMRLFLGLREPKPPIRGVDLAGRVEAVGNAITRFRPGDEVFGGCDGALAEYVATTEDRLVSKPAGVTWAQAATLNVAALTALQGLRDRVKVQRGQSVLVVGAGGGVGTFAVQIAKWLGARVTAVTRTESLELVRRLGADDVIDHRQQDFTRSDTRFDVIFDIGGSRPMSHHRRIMAPKGVLVAIGGPPSRWFGPADRLIKAMVLPRMMPFVAKSNAADRALLAELVEQGALKPVIDRTYPLREAEEAIAYVGAGHPRGKVVVEID
ncbi:MAG TPA: NAD(P)-dependent alcohol dehydrogenase [Thermoanaerobaculia bacterium]|nr:NAD(P)-dependent alcohol dehydrogenase [Thermoanaerobaculia bacterium]